MMWEVQKIQEQTKAEEKKREQEMDRAERKKIYSYTGKVVSFARCELITFD